MSKLSSIVNSEAKKLSKRAGVLDTIDAFTGPISSLCFYSGNEFLFQLGVGLSLSEFLFTKIPFMFDYVKKTGDYKSILFLAPKEVAANITTIGGFLDVFPAYKLRVDYVLRDHLLEYEGNSCKTNNK